ncbi:hypothetical protein AS593_08060 [Caulobacter vibrioides]|nr:hypothetical protein AS593_08060 [Caulobacter vibrioides]
MSLLGAAAAHAQPGSGQPGSGMRGPDADGDGVVTAAEYEAFALQRFERMDANKDGVIDAAELEAIKQRFVQREGQGGPGGGGFGGRMLAQLAAQDADKDGRITRDEALAASRTQFGAADKDGDGKLTGEELRPAPAGGPPPRQ